MFKQRWLKWHAGGGVATATAGQAVLASWMVVLAGCGGPPPRPLPAPEPTLQEQVALVREGKLDQIQVEHTPLTDADLRQLAGLRDLKALLVDHPGSRVSQVGLEALADLPNLAHLRVRGEGIDDAALAVISRMKSLRILNLPRGQFTNAGLKWLAELPQLEQLRFHASQVDDAGMETLAAMPQLSRLHLIGVPITEKGLLTLASMPQLQSLYVDDVQLPDSAWSAFFRQREEMGKPVHVHVDEQHHDRDPHAHPHAP